MFTLNEMILKCQENIWLKKGALEEGEESILELEYNYDLKMCTTIEEFMQFIAFGNWSIRQGVALKNLLFVNQINGGDEWWAIRKQENGRVTAFDSISFYQILSDCGPKEFRIYVKNLLNCNQNIEGSRIS